MNIGLIHFRVGETDGVSLEMEKWKLVLEGLGHKVWYIAGSGDIEDVILVKELHYQNPINELLINHIYKYQDDGYSEAAIKELLEDYTNNIELALLKKIEDYQLDLIVPNNILSLGWNIAAGKAVAQVLTQTNIKAIAHHHDFHWERELYSNPKYPWVKEILAEYFPPVADNLRHVVINNIAQKAMKVKKNLDAVIVPNVFDYEKEWIVFDEYNRTIREDLGFAQSDIIVLQGTRIVARKGIELTIKCIGEMNRLLEAYHGQILYNGKKIDRDTRIKLVCVGLNEDQDYYNKLIAYAKAEKVDLVDVGHRIDFERKFKSRVKCFSLWDAYLLADIVSYPSLLEGFGNQLLEAIYARKPMLIYEYPVYESYIKETGIEALSFGSSHELADNGLAYVEEDINKRVAKEALDLLIDEPHYKLHVDKNYHICLKEFPYNRLKVLLTELIGRN
jgi:hypothetical protein